MKTDFIYKQAGLTLLELMATVGIAAILAAFALPNFSIMVKNNCITTSSNSIISSFHVARSEAVKRQATVTITAASADATNEWGTGWDVTLDEDRNNNGALDSGEDYNGNGALDAAALIRTVSLGCNLTTIDDPDDLTTFVYQPSGFIDRMGTLEVCDDRTAENGSVISLSATGRINTESDFVCP
ncbi:MAG: prepilin-type N-terminal cleavage/methylation domain-containing protein [Gammaproteobacteria bacterium]|nr:prepilin-type N-terminal cleavage/methylation domain-containing protein [Gammaproteobacteria bacterium]NIN62244.1 prepilin-type N-terminal cleavage/methylation domain-containing protein [Gammaproteobacteria bacterium]NIO62255.1 prepilin-type N-terminal cleavage/methylation domain-containing protein [Gammaproteobacteria bacterium]NIP48774.1 prepilin-type N-terminal cleavage/methylation domain-containing protein [Gammaproteobacteria bacterium]NIQ09228.1 prepilin-type N-terminal cleavage/methyl